MSVKEEKLDRVLIVTLDREAKRNAIDGAVTLGIDAALNRLEEDPPLAVAIITGGPSISPPTTCSRPAWRRPGESFHRPASW